jgi:hypothetical protein
MTMPHEMHIRGKLVAYATCGFLPVLFVCAHALEGCGEPLVRARKQAPDFEREEHGQEEE